MTSEHKEKCPTCNGEIDLCPYCREVKPADKKFCEECFALWSEKQLAAQKRYKEEAALIDDEFNYQEPASPLEAIKEDMRKALGFSEDGE